MADCWGFDGGAWIRDLRRCRLCSLWQNILEAHTEQQIYFWSRVISVSASVWMFPCRRLCILKLTGNSLHDWGCLLCVPHVQNKNARSSSLGRFLIYQCKDEFICLHAFRGGKFFFRLKIQGNECVRACESMCVRERDYKGDATMFPQAWWMVTRRAAAL